MPPGNSTSFLIDPWNFQVLSSISLEIPCPQPLSPFSGVLAKNIPKSNLKMTVSDGTKTVDNLKI